MRRWDSERGYHSQVKMIQSTCNGKTRCSSTPTALRLFWLLSIIWSLIRRRTWSNLRSGSSLLELSLRKLPSRRRLLSTFTRMPSNTCTKKFRNSSKGTHMIKLLTRSYQETGLMTRQVTPSCLTSQCPPTRALLRCLFRKCLPKPMTMRPTSRLREWILIKSCPPKMSSCSWTQAPRWILTRGQMPLLRVASRFPLEWTTTSSLGLTRT